MIVAQRAPGTWLGIKIPAFMLLAFALVIPADLRAEPSTIDGEWVLVAVQGLAVDSGGTLNLDDGRLSGSTGCNRFRGSFEIKDNSIKVGPVAATKMYCHERALMERAYLAALETVTEFQLTGDSLVMDYQPGDKMLEFKR